jgi:hypothetical protein
MMSGIPRKHAHFPSATIYQFELKKSTRKRVPGLYRIELLRNAYQFKLGIRRIGGYGLPMGMGL